MRPDTDFSPFTILSGDVTALSERFEGDRSLLLAVVQLSLRKRSLYLPIAGVQGEPTDGLLRQLHNSASLFGIFGCEQLMQACRDWEARVAGSAPVDAQDVAHWLQVELTRLFTDIGVLEARLLAV